MLFISYVYKCIWSFCMSLQHKTKSDMSGQWSTVKQCQRWQHTEHNLTEALTLGRIRIAERSAPCNLSWSSSTPWRGEGPWVTQVCFPTFPLLWCSEWRMNDTGSESKLSIMTRTTIQRDEKNSSSKFLDSLFHDESHSFVFWHQIRFRFR